MGYAVVARDESSDGVHLVLHQGDQRGYDYGCAIHDKRRKLVAKGFAASGRHENKGIVLVYKVSDDAFLVGLE